MNYLLGLRAAAALHRLNTKNMDNPSELFDASLWQALPNANELLDGGIGVRFEVQTNQATNNQAPAATQASMLPAFAVKHGGQVYAYLNQCAHVAMEMDWQAGQFFDFDAQYIMCATHGALYEPATGRCIAGPCVGKQLKPIALHYYDKTLYASRYATPP